MDEVSNKLKILLKKRDAIVLAVSGGPDSIFLLYLLNRLKKELDLKIIVAHVNHNLRDESLEEASFVENLCESFDLRYEYMEILEYSNDNLESEARYKRYAFFKDLVKKYNAQYLMTAHHGDDLVETIMMRIVRGSSIKGYSGFREIITMDNYKIVRPLITLSKDLIVKYLDDNNIKYYVDKSNFSLEFTRNRYRMKLLPFLKSENSNVHKKFLKFSQELFLINDFLVNYIENILKDIKDSKGINISKLLVFDDFLIKKIIEYEFSLVYVDDLFLISDKNTSQIMKLIKSNNSNGSVSLPNNYLAIKDYNYFRIELNKESLDYEMILDDYLEVPSGVIKKIRDNNLKNNYIIRLNSRDIVLPLKVRNKRNGDKIMVKNLNGSKKIKDIFIDEKILKSKRDSYPLVLDSENKILWVPGVKKSKFDVETSGIYDIILAYEEE